MSKIFYKLLCCSLFALILTACPGKEKPADKPSSSASTSSTSSAAPAASTAPSAPNPPSPASSLSTPVGAVKTFFEAVYNKKYDIAWSTLSTTSQNKIIKMVAEEEKTDEAKIRDLFNKNDTQLQIGFWNAFRDSSKVEMFIPTAKYKLVSEKGNEANVEVTALSANLENKVFKEANGWRMGYIETYMPELLP